MSERAEGLETQPEANSRTEVERLQAELRDQEEELSAIHALVGEVAGEDAQDHETAMSVAAMLLDRLSATQAERDEAQAKVESLTDKERRVSGARGRGGASSQRADSQVRRGVEGYCQGGSVMSERTEANKARDLELRMLTASRLEEVARRLRAGEDQLEIDGVSWLGFGSEENFPAGLGAWLARSIAEREIEHEREAARTDGEWHGDTCRIGWGVQVQVEHAVAEQLDPVLVEDEEGVERETGEHYTDFKLEPISDAPETGRRATGAVVTGCRVEEVEGGRFIVRRTSEFEDLVGKEGEPA